MPLTGPSRVAGEPSQSSAGSGIFFQGDRHSQSMINSQLSTSLGNSANSNCETGRSNIEPVSGDVNHTVLNSVANSGPSVGASSLVTDANSAFSGGPRLQRSASINAESYLRLPASPMSFSSNNISGSCSSVIDGPPMAQQGSHRDLNPQQQAIQSQLPLSMGPRVSTSFIQDHAHLSHQQKKPRLDIKQEDILQQHVLQQLLQRQDPMQLQSHNPQLQFILQQQRLRQLQQQQQQQQQQQILQAMPQMQRAHLQQQQQQQQLRQHMQQQSAQQVAVMRNPYDTGGVCARRLMQYLYHQRQRPSENSIAYWRKFVAEYYAPRAKKRWCLSLYDNVGHHALGVFPQAAMDVWHCDICGSKSGRGFEATYEVLPRLNEIKFGSGVIDELLFLDWPRERRIVNGIMILEYGKAVQESVYEQLRVVREGQLRIIFTQDLKILSWEFCARRHEELLPRRLVAPQVHQLLQVAQKCQSTIADSGSDGVSSQDLQTTSNMVVTASRQLAKILELQSLNDLGFSKRYVRCLQIAEVVNSMKDLIDFCGNSEVGPIEGLKSYPRHASTSMLQMQRIQDIEQQLSGFQGLPTDRNTISKLMAMQQPGINPHVMGNIHNMNTTDSNTRASLGGPIPAALALSNFQNVMLRQNSMNSNSNPHHAQEASSPLNNNPNQSPSPSFQGSMQSISAGGFPGNKAAGQQKVMFGGQNVNPNPTASGVGYGNLETPSTPALSSNVSGGGPTLSKSSSVKGEPSNSELSAAGGGGGGFNQKAPYLPQMVDDIVPDLPHDFAENMFFSSDIDDNLGFGWKAPLSFR